MQLIPDDAWLIRHQGDYWWRAERKGYASDIVSAGVYSEAEALALASNRSYDTAVRLADVVRGLRTEDTVWGLLVKGMEDK